MSTRLRAMYGNLCSKPVGVCITTMIRARPGHYHLKDYLGTPRVTFTDVDNDGQITQADVLEQKTTYPFGMFAFGFRASGYDPDRLDFTGHQVVGSTTDRYHATMDMQARYYSPGMASFVGVDPLASSFPSYTPYNYTMNDPINLVDPDGRAPACPSCVVRGGMVGARVLRASRVARGARTASRGGRIATALADEGAAIAHDFNTLTSASATIGERAGALSDLVLGSWFNEANDASAAEEAQSGDDSVPWKLLPDGTAAPAESLPREQGGMPAADGEAEGREYSTLGTKGKGDKAYRQSAEFDKNGKAIRETDHTDHGTPHAHENPHNHTPTIDKSGSYRRPPEG